MQNAKKKSQNHREGGKQTKNKMVVSAGNWLCQAGTGKRKHRRRSLQHRKKKHKMKL